jgi:hypothetical protein
MAFKIILTFESQRHGKTLENNFILSRIQVLNGGDYEYYQLLDVHGFTSQKAVILFDSNIIFLQLYLHKIKFSCKYPFSGLFV